MESELRNRKNTSKSQKLKASSKSQDSLVETSIEELSKSTIQPSSDLRDDVCILVASILLNEDN
jgi:hypothetical protein